jgi:hypothetical protein
MEQRENKKTRDDYTSAAMSILMYDEDAPKAGDE